MTISEEFRNLMESQFEEYLYHYGGRMLPVIRKFWLSKLREEKLKLLDRVTLEIIPILPEDDTDTHMECSGHNLIIDKLESLKSELRKELE